MKTYKIIISFIIVACYILIFSFQIITQETKGIFIQKIHEIIKEHNTITYIRILDHHKTHAFYTPNLILDLDRLILK
ncbi:hypothetical protein AS54_5490 (plasmid) [Bacillus cereus 03BB102]|uniref:Uncharacterized protein n=1 Tax=Bacillus cereus (strain 03BB102) TaxID=572264 RepID=A0A125YA53_BACC3|nr:hypothetical protein BCA_A0141 [Bacillus cereus 03BB102]AJG51221.1 hypothetical protein AS54_5490 [Bacillus cereus 03BB102]